MTRATIATDITRSTVRRFGTRAAAVTVSVWGAQPTSVRVATGGGHDDHPYIAVRVGDCLTYVYDRPALASYLGTWRKAAVHNREHLRLPATAEASMGQPGQDFTIACRAFGSQRCAISDDSSRSGARRLLVSVGAHHVHVYASEGLRSHLHAWTEADTLAAVFDDLEANRRRRL